jgi:hypothetical protein
MLKGFGETAPERDIKFAHVDLKSVEADDTFSGYASLFNQMHSGHDLVNGGRVLTNAYASVGRSKRCAREQAHLVFLEPGWERPAQVCDH